MKKSRQQIWQDKRREAGCCICCGKKKPDGHEQDRCLSCTSTASRRAIVHYHANPRRRQQIAKWARENRKAKADCRRIVIKLKQKEGNPC